NLVEGFARGLPDPQRLLLEKSQALDERLERLDLAMRGWLRHRGAELETLGHRLPHPRQQLRVAAQALDAQGERLVPAVRPPLQEVRHAAQSLDACGARLLPAVTRLLSAKQEVMESSARLLSSLSYKQTLARGYAVVRGPEGVLQRAQEVGPGATLRLEFF